MRGLVGYSPWGCKELGATETALAHVHQVTGRAFCIYQQYRAQMQKIKYSKRYEEKSLTIVEGKYPSSLACVPHSHPHLYPGWGSLEHSRGCCVHAHWILREEGG